MLFGMGTVCRYVLLGMGTVRVRYVGAVRGYAQKMWSYFQNVALIAEHFGIANSITFLKTGTVGTLYQYTDRTHVISAMAFSTAGLSLYAVQSL